VGVVSPNAQGDTGDDLTRVAALMRAENYSTAERVASESLAKGPRGFLSGIMTLSIKHWRAQARLLLGDVAGSIEDAEAIIAADSSLMRPDAGYSLRAIARALTGDTREALADFEAAGVAAESGLSNTDRTILVLASRGIAKLQINDLDGAYTDLTRAIEADYGWTIKHFVSSPEEVRELLELIRSAVPMIQQGNMSGAEEAMDKALLTILSSKGLKDLFLPNTLLLTKVAGRAHVSATRRASASSSAVNPAVDSIRKSQQHFDRAVAAIDAARSAEDFEKSITEFKLAINLSPGWTDAYYNLGLVQEATDSYRDATASFRHYEALVPHAVGADSLRAFISLKNEGSRQNIRMRRLR
jgi:tetratricopeptide (TPR) repeat protein